MREKYVALIPDSVASLREIKRSGEMPNESQQHIVHKIMLEFPDIDEARAIRLVEIFVEGLHEVVQKLRVKMEQKRHSVHAG